MMGAIRWWLNYHASVGRYYILSESSLKIPITEYLERSNVKDITLELSHPSFSGRRVDVSFNDDEVKKQIVFELKYVKGALTKNDEEKQRFFNDLARLYFINQTDTESYFVVCGEQVEFIANFQRIVKYQGTVRVRKSSQLPKDIDSEGFYTNWFSFDLKKPEKEIDLVNCNSECKLFYTDFVTDYAKGYKKSTGKDLKLPPKITTKLVYISENSSESDKVYLPSRVAVWSVK